MLVFKQCRVMLPTPGPGGSQLFKCLSRWQGLSGAARLPPQPQTTKIAIALIGHSGSFSIYSNAADSAAYMLGRRGRKTTL